MTKLKLSTIETEKPVKLNIELAAQVYRDLNEYAEILAREAGGTAPVEPAKLVAPMLQRFMATDREFGRRRRPAVPPAKGGAPSSVSA